MRCCCVVAHTDSDCFVTSLDDEPFNVLGPFAAGLLDRRPCAVRPCPAVLGPYPHSLGLGLAGLKGQCPKASGLARRTSSTRPSYAQASLEEPDEGLDPQASGPYARRPLLKILMRTSSRRPFALLCRASLEEPEEDRAEADVSLCRASLEEPDVGTDPQPDVPYVGPLLE